MKHLMILAVGLCFLNASSLVVAEEAEDEAAIKKVYSEYISAFNAHDTKAIAALHDDVFEHWKGIYKGRDGAEKQHEDMFSRQKDWRLKVVDEINLIFVTPDVAVYKLRVETSGIVDPLLGDSLPTVEFLQANVYVKREGQWLRAAVFSRDIEE